MLEDKIISYLDLLAEKLGVAVPYLYEVMHKQMIIEGITYGLICIGLIIAFYIVEILLYKKMQENRYECWDIGFICTSVMGGIVALIAVFVFGDSILQIINPDYYVLKDILGGIQ